MTEKNKQNICFHNKPFKMANEDTKDEKKEAVAALTLILSMKCLISVLQPATAHQRHQSD